MEWWNRTFSSHNIVKWLVDNLGFKLMLITSSMVMSALSGQLATAFLYCKQQFLCSYSECSYSVSVVKAIPI